MDSNPHTSSTRQIQNRFDERIAAPTLSQQPPLQCTEAHLHFAEVYVKKGSCLQHMPLCRQKQQTNLCHNRQRRIVSFTQPWRCGTFNAAIPLDLSPVGRQRNDCWVRPEGARDYLFPMSSVRKCVVHVLSLSPASLSPVLTLLWCRPQCTHLSPLCNTATSCLGALECQAGMAKVRAAYKERGRKKYERGRSRIDRKRESGEERVGQGKQGGIQGKERESERDLRAHPTLIKEPSP